MTTLAAVKKGKKICIGADSLSTFGSRKEINGTHVENGEKIISIGPNLVGVAGHASWTLILQDYFSGKSIQSWKGANEIFNLYNKMHHDLKNKYYLTPPHLGHSPFESSEFSLLIVNSYGIFEISYNRVVREYVKYSAIGTGEEYALGAICSSYDIIQDPEEIVKIGIEAAAEFNQKTSKPVRLFSVASES